MAINENDQIQNYVEECANKLFEKITGTKLCIAHFLCGTIGTSDASETSAAIRKSSIRVGTSCSLESYLGQEPSDTKLRNIKHRDVLRDYIRGLDRRHTFLSVIEKIFLEKMNGINTPNKLVIQIKIDTAILSPHEFDYDNGDKSDDSYTVNWKFGNNLPKILIPTETNKYLRYLYSSDHSQSKDEKWHLFFQQARSEAFGRISLEYEEKHRILKKEEKKCLWEKLAALQAAMLYLKQCVNAEDKILVRGTAILIKLKTEKDKPPPLGVVILSPGIENNQIVEVENIVREFLCEATNIVFPSGVIEAEHIKPSFAGNTESEKGEQRSDFKGRMNKIEIFKLPVQKQRAEIIGLWLLCLTERLQNSVHEGELLDFFFVIGDKSEFQDHSQITFKDFEKSTPQDLKLLAVPESRNDLLENYEEALKILAKEHFPWFQGGRNALFWDVSGDSFRPLGLVAIKGSSWEYIVADRHYDRQSVDIPNCVTMFTTASSKSAGAIMTTGKKVEEIAKLKNSQWNVIGDDREKNLKDQLKLIKSIILAKAVGNSYPPWLNEIARLAILVADNPKTGGIILISNNKNLFSEDLKTQIFSKMGKAWTFENLSLEDRIALIAHDGATARNMTNTDWKHRLLLIPDGVCSDVKKEMVEYSQALENKFPLSCVGSRRWSAAMAAFHPAVKAVIVISQDGDILCWANKLLKNTLKGALCLKLPQSGKAQKYDFTKRKWMDIK